MTAPGRPVPVIALACTSCQLVYQPDLAAFDTGNTGCPRCGGWTWVAQLGHQHGPECPRDAEGTGITWLCGQPPHSTPRGARSVSAAEAAATVGGDQR